MSVVDSIFPIYTHIVNPKLKHIYLSFDSDGKLIVKSPKVTQREIEKILIKKASWITKSRQRLLEKRGKPLKFVDGEELFFLGERYPIYYELWSKKRPALDFDEQRGFCLSYLDFDTDKFENLINRFYKQKAQELIPDLTQNYANKMELFPSKVSFRKARSRWGSCSSSNAISFNYLMMKLPLSVIEYIVVHELSHIKHKHHQRDFWKFVALYMPNYQEQRAQLKRYM